MLLSAIANRRTALDRAKADAFVLTVRTTTASEVVTLPFVSTGLYNCTVQWGDGSQSKITAWDDVAVAHTYVASGDYQIAINGQMTAWEFGTVLVSQSHPISMDQWGDTGLLSLANGFRDCVNLVSVADGTLPDLINVSAGFRSTHAMLTSPVLTMPNVTDLLRIFQDTRFAVLRSFDTSNVTGFNNMTRDNPNVHTYESLDYSGMVANASMCLNNTSLANFLANQFDAMTATFTTSGTWLNCALNEQSVDNIIVSFDNAPVADWGGITINLSGGTSAAPSATGDAAVTSLAGKNMTVAHN